MSAMAGHTLVDSSRCEELHLYAALHVIARKLAI